MPAARKTTRKTAVPSQDVAVIEEQVEEKPAPKKRASRKKIVENVIAPPENTSTLTSSGTGFVFLPDVPKTTEVMERVKSKVEMFNKSEHTNLLKNILERYGSRIGEPGSPESLRKAYTEFTSQVTENQNGVFLNLTSCSDDLWQACVQCIEQLERQHTDLEKLDKERQMAIEEMAKNV